jgi:hypothetical protein
LLWELKEWLMLSIKLLSSLNLLAIIPRMPKTLLFPLWRNHWRLVVNMRVISGDTHRFVVPCMATNVITTSSNNNWIGFL